MGPNRGAATRRSDHLCTLVHEWKVTKGRRPERSGSSSLGVHKKKLGWRARKDSNPRPVASKGEREGIVNLLTLKGLRTRLLFTSAGSVSVALLVFLALIVW